MTRWRSESVRVGALDAHRQRRAWRDWRRIFARAFGLLAQDDEAVHRNGFGSTSETLRVGS